MGRTQVWIAGKFIAETDQGRVWEFQGVFETETDAVAACLTSAYFIGPCFMGEPFPDETMEWPGAYYPRAIDDYRDSDPDGPDPYEDEK